MYKTILVPLDGSGMAEAILPHVEEVARLCGAAVTFLNVIELPHIIPQDKGESYTGLPHVTAAEVEQQGQEARRYLDELIAREAAKGITARGLVEHGPIVATILRLAAEASVDLIAMASHGRGGLADVYYGSVAAGVLQRIDRPLLIVRAQ
jgi:nucleotide-binding universal stress UspA family protein